MRTTKALLCAAALAAGVVTSMAQNVYSLNVVGYVNKTFSSGNYVLVANPLSNGANDLNTIIPNPPALTQVNIWDTSLQDFSSTIPVFNAGVWTPNVTLPPGQGFFVIAGADFTNTFVGNVLQGSVTNPVPLVGGGNYLALGNAVPVGGSLVNVLAGYTPSNLDQVNLWDVSLQDFSSTIPVFNAGTWTPDINLPVGDGFFLIRSSASTTTWVQNFTVQ
jgi:hypothetical protein